MGVWLVELVGAEKGEEVLYRGRTAESCLHCVVVLVHYAVAAAAGALQSAKRRRQRRRERNVSCKETENSPKSIKIHTNK